jgi:hypothetical protein
MPYGGEEMGLRPPPRTVSETRDVRGRLGGNHRPTSSYKSPASANP